MDTPQEAPGLVWPPPLVPIGIETPEPRPVITAAKMPMLQAALTVLRGVLRPYLPVSVRKIHYELLNLCPLFNADDPTRHYSNTRSDYQNLSDLLTRARVCGLLPWPWITDDTRPCLVWVRWATVHAFVEDKRQAFLQGYHRNLLQSQPDHVEIVCEKNTVHNIIVPVAMAYGVTVMSGRGFADIGSVRDIAERYRASKKARLILVALTDHDPEGEQIVQTVGGILWRDFGVTPRHLEISKVAITAEQVRLLDLPPDMDAKMSSSNYAKFAARYGTAAFELEALAPQMQQDLLRHALDSVLTLSAFEAEQARERTEQARLAQLRARLGPLLQRELSAL
jgi:hypothetical protein